MNTEQNKFIPIQWMSECDDFIENNIYACIFDEYPLQINIPVCTYSLPFQPQGRHLHRTPNNQQLN